MQSKSTTKTDTQQFIHKIPAGILPGDHSVEIFGCRNTRDVFFTSNGVTDNFSKLSNTYKNKLLAKLKSDKVAWNDLKHLETSEALKRFAFCVYGSLDHQPDIDTTGFLGRGDNFICGKDDCNCKNWTSKQIQFEGNVIKGKVLEVLLAYRKGRDDKNVASDLNIAAATLNNHKQKLFQIFNVGNKTEMVIAAINAKIIQ